MTIFDEFTHYGQYLGEDPISVTPQNFDQLTELKGREWVAGYLAALEVVAVNVADILIDREDILGRESPPYRVRKDLKKYWAHNKELYLSVIKMLDRPTNDSRIDTNEPK